MARFVIPGAASLSEFVGLPQHQFGDCGPDATLMALHALWPAKYPLTPYGLGTLDEREESQHYADMDGAQTITSIHNYLAALGISHHFWGFGTPNIVDILHRQLKNYLAFLQPDPIIIEVAAAGIGFRDDEPGVQFHFVAFFGEDDSEAADSGEYIGGYLRGDGDSRTDNPNGSTTPLILTPWPDIAAAQPIGIIQIHAVQTAAVEYDHIVHGPMIVR